MDLKNKAVLHALLKKKLLTPFTTDTHRTKCSVCVQEYVQRTFLKNCKNFVNWFVSVYLLRTSCKARLK